MNYRNIGKVSDFCSFGMIREKVHIQYGAKAEAEFPLRILLIKRLIDIILSFILLLVLSPLFVLVGIGVIVESRGGALFTQKRLGKGARVFVMFKFRSMVEKAEFIGDGLACYGEDFRVTKLGKVIRVFALDELPQLFNVLKGEMSLVGPRPPVHNELGDLAKLPAKVLLRFCIKPGITGLAQVAGRSELAWPEKIRFDEEYVQRLRVEGFTLDLQIALKTICVLINRNGVYDIKGKNQKF